MLLFEDENGKQFIPGNAVGEEIEDEALKDLPRVNESDGTDDWQENILKMKKYIMSMQPMLLDNGGGGPEPLSANGIPYAENDPLNGKLKEIDSFSSITAPAKADQCPLLVLKVGFNDVKCLFTDQEWNQRIFGNGSTGNSVSDYYSKMSNGKFTYVPAAESAGALNDGVIDVTLPIDRPLYASGGAGQNYDKGARAGMYTGTDNHTYIIYNQASLYMYALNAADNDIDYKSYDRNGDGYISPTELAVVAND